MDRAPRLSLRLFSLAAILLFIAGCHSAGVQVTVRNTGATRIRNIEVDYPSASFGIPSLAPGESFHYRLKLKDAGRMKVQFTDNAEKTHSGTGPYAAEGQQGTLTIALDGSGKNVWTENLHPQVQAPKSE